MRNFCLETSLPSMSATGVSPRFKRESLETREQARLRARKEWEGRGRGDALTGEDLSRSEEGGGESASELQEKTSRERVVLCRVLLGVVAAVVTTDSP